jgi:hypothetical protein
MLTNNNVLFAYARSTQLTDATCVGSRRRGAISRKSGATCRDSFYTGSSADGGRADGCRTDGGRADGGRADGSCPDDSDRADGSTSCPDDSDRADGRRDLRVICRPSLCGPRPDRQGQFALQSRRWLPDCLACNPYDRLCRCVCAGRACVCCTRSSCESPPGGVYSFGRGGDARCLVVVLSRRVGCGVQTQHHYCHGRCPTSVDDHSCSASIDFKDTDRDPSVACSQPLDVSGTPHTIQLSPTRNQQQGHIASCACFLLLLFCCCCHIVVFLLRHAGWPYSVLNHTTKKLVQKMYE